MIDVLLSVRNGEEFLANSIESILNQTYKDFLFHIIDDASSDNSVKLIKSYHDVRIRFYQNTVPLGLTKNLNYLYRQGKNPYLARQDADDVSYPLRFQEELNYLKSNNFDLVGCFADLINEKGLIISKNEYRGHNIKRDLFQINPFPHASWLLKREVMEKLGGYDENYLFSQDYELLLRMSHKYRIGVVPKKLMSYRILNRSVSLKNLKKQQYYSFKARFAALKRGTHSLKDLPLLIKPALSYFLPAKLNKYLYKIFYGY